MPDQSPPSRPSLDVALKDWNGITGTPLTALLTVLVAVGPLSISFYVPSLPDIATALDTTPAAAQATMTTFLAGFAGAQLLYGPMSDRFGRLPVLSGAFLIFIVASLICAATTSIDQLLVARFAQGFGACCGPILGRAMVRDLFEGVTMVRVFAIMGAAVAIAPAIAPSLGGLIEQRFGWEASFISLAIVGAIILWLARRFLKETNLSPNPEALVPKRLAGIYRGLLVNPHFMGNVLVGALIFASVFAYHTITSFLFMEKLGLSPAVYGLLAFITVPAYMGGNILAGKLAGRISSRRLITVGLICAIFGSGLIILLSTDLSIMRVIAPFFIYFFGFGLILPNSISGALHPFPRVAGSASAVMGCTQMACGALSSTAASLLYTGSGAAELGWIALSLSCLAALSYFGLVRN